MSSPYLGEIRYFGFNWAPDGWALCNGQLLPIANNAALFSLLGTQYGGDGETSFALPDLRGRAPLHQGTGAGLSNRTVGERAGQQEVSLTVSQMPSHSHHLIATNDDRNTNRPVAALPAKGGEYHDGSGTPTLAAMDSQAIGNTGGGQAHNNMPPYLVISACIALEGIFPSGS